MTASTDTETERIDARWEQAQRIVVRTDESVPADASGLAVHAYPSRYDGDPAIAGERDRSGFSR